jgi:hypothetical protein
VKRLLILDEDDLVCLSVALCVLVSKSLSGQLFGQGKRGNSRSRVPPWVKAPPNPAPCRGATNLLNGRKREQGTRKLKLAKSAGNEPELRTYAG